MFAPLCTKTLDNLAPFICVLLRLTTTMVYSSYDAVRSQPRYLKYDTKVSGRPYAWKYRSVIACISSSESLIVFHSDPLEHWAVLGWRPVKSAHITNISYQGHCGWGRLPSSKMIMVSHMCRCRNCTRSPILISTPDNP